jgi:imidazoleglycerol phosphate dehydratase HisB
MRRAKVNRETKETKIRVSLNLDGSGKADISTGIGFLDHMLTALAHHGRFDIKLSCSGDLDVDDHHTTEDCALVLGKAFNDALGDKRGVRRFGCACVPMDESLARAVIDLSGRPFAGVNLKLSREFVGETGKEINSENLTHFIRSLAMSGMMTVHVDVLKGDNDHHKAEAAFKALALALNKAVRIMDGAARLKTPSTKGVL